MALVLLAGTVLLTLGRGLGDLRPARRHVAGARRRQPLPGRRRHAAARRSPRCSTPGRARRSRAAAPGHRPRPAAAAARCCRTSRWWPRSSPSAPSPLDRPPRRAAPPSPASSVCVVLAAVHRWLTAREEQRLAARLRRSEAYFRSLVRSSGDAVVILDDDLRITLGVPGARPRAGRRPPPLVGRPLLDAVHPDDAAARSPPPWPRRRRSDGRADRRAAAAPAAATPTGSGATSRPASPTCAATPTSAPLVLHCRDMTERHAREQALQSVAYTDPMTGLPNRAGFHAARPRGRRRRRPDAPRRCCWSSSTGWPTAREHAGREVVAAVVAEIGRRLRATVRGEDVVARLGGGAFAVLAARQRRRGRPAGRPLPRRRRAADRTAGGHRRADRRASGWPRSRPGCRSTSLLGRRRPRRPAPPAPPGPGRPRRYDDDLGDAAAAPGAAARRPARAPAPAASCPCSSSPSSRSSDAAGHRHGGAAALAAPRARARCRRRSSCPSPSAPA